MRTEGTGLGVYSCTRAADARYILLKTEVNGRVAHPFMNQPTLPLGTSCTTMLKLVLQAAEIRVVQLFLDLCMQLSNQELCAVS